MTVLIDKPINTGIVEEMEACWDEFLARLSVAEQQEETTMIGQIDTVPGTTSTRSPRTERGSRRKHNRRKAPKYDKPPLTRQQSRQLRRGVMPKGVIWSEVKLSRRQQHWVKEIRRRSMEAKLLRQAT